MFGWNAGWMDGYTDVGAEGTGKNNSTTPSACNLGDFMITPCTLSDHSIWHILLPAHWETVTI
jgi:hypothetical protein